MTPESIPDRAATLVNQRNEAESAIDAVKHLDGDWTAYALLVRDIVNGAHEHLNLATLEEHRRAAASILANT